MRPPVLVSLEPVMQPPLLIECGGIASGLQQLGYDPIVQERLQYVIPNTLDELAQHAVNGLPYDMDTAVSFAGYVFPSMPTFAIEGHEPVMAQIMFCSAKVHGYEIMITDYLTLLPPRIHVLLEGAIQVATESRLNELRKRPSGCLVSEEEKGKLRQFVQHLHASVWEALLLH